MAKRWALQDNQKLIFRHDLCPQQQSFVLHYTHKPLAKVNRKRNNFSSVPVISFNNVGLGAVHDASFMQQLNGGSQSAYCLMLCDTAMYEGKARTHLLDWGSSKIHRKMRSTLAAEASSAAKVYDGGAYALSLIHI